jgi:hypothetical protein
VEGEILAGHPIRRRHADLREQHRVAGFVTDNVEIERQKLLAPGLVGHHAGPDETETRMRICPSGHHGHQFNPRPKRSVPPGHAATNIAFPHIERAPHRAVKVRREELRRLDRNMIEMSGPVGHRRQDRQGGMVPGGMYGSVFSVGFATYIAGSDGPRPRLPAGGETVTISGSV